MTSHGFWESFLVDFRSPVVDVLQVAVDECSHVRSKARSCGKRWENDTKDVWEFGHHLHTGEHQVCMTINVMIFFRHSPGLALWSKSVETTIKWFSVETSLHYRTSRKQNLHLFFFSFETQIHNKITKASRWVFFNLIYRKNHCRYYGVH